MENTSLIAQKAINNLLETTKNMQVIKDEDVKFLAENKNHIAKVFEKVHMWRTNTQKLSIISDEYFPTLHSKFHQSILESKVQTDQLFYLMKGFEEKKLEIEELALDLEETKGEMLTKRNKIEIKKIELNLAFKKYELNQQKIAAEYRMREIKDWTKIQQALLEKMKDKSEEEIWTKDAGQIEFMFFSTLTNLHGIEKTTDGAEYNNLMSLAKFSIQQAKELNIYSSLVKRCNKYQLDSLKFLGEIQ